MVGAARAAEILLTGRQFSAAECLAFGLVSQAVPGEEILVKARELAYEIIQGSPTSLALTRRAIHNGLAGTLDNALEFEALALEQCYTSPDHKEYVAAFVEKRKPIRHRARH